MTYHYSATPFLAWAINHYFYNGIHYVWAAGDFYPYRQPNPKSSNPLLIYLDIYHPWKDSDPYDKFIAQQRLSLRKGVLAQQILGTITAYRATKLKEICDKVDVAFFYPVVYRIDTSKIASTRLKIAGSGTAGSKELLIEDLAENEFDILFLDFYGDPDFDALKVGSIGDVTLARPILKGRC